MIERSDLEKWMSVDKAGILVREFFDDNKTYPDDNFYSHHRGINKDILEELWPLLLLARSLPKAEALRLTFPANEGHDGEIRIGDKSIVSIQVTSSRERDRGYLVRQKLLDKGHYLTTVRNTLEVVEERFRRIIGAIIDKEKRYRKGTDILLIQEQSVSWGEVLESTLKVRLAEWLTNSEPSKYSATYITFNENVYRLR